MLDDDARYQCQVSPGPNNEPAIRSHFANLTVLVPPDPPKIVQGDYLVTTEDREIELECVSYGGKPAAEITWIDGLGNVLTDGIEYIVDELSDKRRFTAKSILKLTPRKEHHNTTFTCQAQNTAERTHRSAKLKLEVRNKRNEILNDLIVFTIKGEIRSKSVCNDTFRCCSKWPNPRRSRSADWLPSRSQSIRCNIPMVHQ